MVHIKPENVEYAKEFAWHISGGFTNPLLTFELRVRGDVTIGKDITTILHQVRLNSELLSNQLQQYISEGCYGKS